MGAAIVAFIYRGLHPGQSPDFTQHWIVARGVWEGGQPSPVLAASGWRYPGYYYPLTAAVAVLPIAWLPLPVAQVFFVGASFSVLAYALSARGWWGLIWLVSGPVLMASAAGQWAPLLTAGIAIGGLRGLWVVKPNIALALAAGWGVTRQAVIVGLALTICSFVLDPTWPLDLLGALPNAHHVVAPVLRPGGILLLLALVRWRSPAARYLVAFALIPQTTGLYDMVPLAYCARSQRELMVLTASTQLALVLQRDAVPGQAAAGLTWFWPYALGLCYLPSLFLVLRRPNTG